MVNLLAGQKVYLDSSVLIYLTEAPDIFPQLRPVVLEPFARGEIVIVTSWITLAEVLTKPLRISDSILSAAYRGFFTPSAQFQILPVGEQISCDAASIRALHGFKLPDAIHIATGMSAMCDAYLTGDLKWADAGINVIDIATL